MFGRDEQAVAQMLTFLVAGVLFVGSVGTVLYFTRTAATDDDAVASATTNIDAASLADLLVGSTGVGWENGPDNLVRLGLLATNRSGLDAAHLDLMRGASYAANATNNRLDYEEAEASVGLTGANTDFHISIYPIGLKQTLAQADLSSIRTGYIGHWNSLGSTTVLLGTNEQMVATANANLNTTMSTMALNERTILRSVGVGFTDNIHITSTPNVQVDTGVTTVPITDLVNLTFLAGDVYPDNKQYIDTVLPGRLAEYDLIMVGSTVSHESLTSAVTKDAIRDWVLAGGTIMVMGSDSQNFQWMQPLFNVGTDTVNGGAFAPDVGHAMLHEPHELNWPAYDNFGLAWDIKTQGANAYYDDFEHIIQEDGEDVLAVSGQGAFGDGRIFLSTFRPGDIYDTLGASEADNLVMNMALYADRSNLYLEYGPGAPTGTQVATAVRQSHLWDYQVGQVPVRIEVNLWRSVDISTGNRVPYGLFTSTCTGLTCSFDASNSIDPDGDPLTYTWDWGDGNNATGAAATHTYLSGGDHTVTLTVSDGTSSDTAARTVSPTAPNQAPTAAFTAGPVLLVVTFDASTSTDPDTDPLTYSWDFGDGNTATGIAPVHVYLSGGTYNATLTVDDGRGGTDALVQPVTVSAI